MPDPTVTSRSQRPTPASILAAVGAAVVLFAMVQLLPLAVAYRGVDRVELDTGGFGAPVSGESPPPAQNDPGTVIAAADIDQPTTFLVIGTDEREGLDDLSHFGDFEGRRADVIMLAVVRPESPPVLVSIPRDLWAPDPCGEGNARINEALAGCDGKRNGPSALAAVVESVTGLTVDHFIEVDLAGFQEVIDHVGGYMICVEHPVRDLKSGLDLPDGCTLASGEQTLAWVRSRSTEEYVDGTWRRMAGVNDLTRNARQRELMIDMFGRLKEVGAEGLLALATSSADDLTLDSGLDLRRAVSLFQAVRSVRAETIESLSIPVADDIRGGAAVLVATVDIEEWLSVQLEEQTVAASPVLDSDGFG